MIIMSVYSSQDAATAFVRLSSEGEEIRLLEACSPQLRGQSLFTAIERAKPDICIFNGVLVGGERHSFLAELAKSNGINGVEISEPFHSGEGMELFWDVQARKAFDASACREWNKLAAKLERAETRKAAQPMALLQGLIAADKEAKRDTGPPLFGFEHPPSSIPEQDSRTAYGVFRSSPHRNQPPI